jgi:hypothetical protein
MAAEAGCEIRVGDAKATTRTTRYPARRVGLVVDRAPLMGTSVGKENGGGWGLWGVSAWGGKVVEPGSCEGPHK